MRSFAKKANRWMVGTAVIPSDRYASTARAPTRISNCRLNGGCGDLAPKLGFNVCTTNNPNPGCRSGIADQTRRQANFNLFSRRFTFRSLLRVLVNRASGITFYRGEIHNALLCGMKTRVLATRWGSQIIFQCVSFFHRLCAMGWVRLVDWRTMLHQSHPRGSGCGLIEASVCLFPIGESWETHSTAKPGPARRTQPSLKLSDLVARGFCGGRIMHRSIYVGRGCLSREVALMKTNIFQNTLPFRVEL